MKILLTGANGYIGMRLLPQLVAAGHDVYCAVRDPKRLSITSVLAEKVTILTVDFLSPKNNSPLPLDIDVAYYLIHSMSSDDGDFLAMEAKCAHNFCSLLEKTNAKQIIYLSGIVNDKALSKHLSSRKNVEDILKKSRIPSTVLRAGIIVGSGSASFEIIRDLVEKLPVMVTPKWLNTRCQPIGISDVIAFLSKSIFNSKTFDRDFDIGGPDILSYKEMLLEFSRMRKLNRKIFTVPVMTPRLSSYWLYFVTSTSYKLAVALVNSMKIEVICRNTDLNNILKVTPISYKKSLSKAFAKIKNNEIVSSWKDAYASSGFSSHISDFIEIPTFGCFRDQRKLAFKNKEDCIEKIWSIGGQTGWYYGDWLWKIRGFIDRLVGGVGLRRGRTSLHTIDVGDALDFWRVLYANKKEGRLLLFAEMKLPGEAWLEFKIESGKLIQTATYRPLGLMGRLYWYLVLPFHGAIFNGMLKKLTSSNGV